MAGEKILIIDDSADQREIIADDLKLKRYKLLFANDGIKGLKEAREHHPDLILLDLQMKPIDGQEVLRRLKAENIDVPVILMTAHGTEEIAVEVFRQGVKDYLIKPYKYDELEAAIERCLGESRWRKDEARLRREKDEITERLIETNARLNKRLRDLKILYSIGKSVTALLDTETLMLRVVGAATLLTSSHEGSIYVMEDDQLICRAIKSYGEQRPYISKQVLNDPLAAQAAATGKVVIVHNEAALNGQGGGGNSVSSEVVSGMAAPLMITNRCVGVLVVRNVLPEAPHFSDHDGELLSALSDYAAIAFENAAHYRAKGEIQEEDRINIHKAFESKSVFVSYSHTDWDEFVQPLVERMRAEGLEVRIDQDAMESGQDWLDKINELLESSDYLVLAVTPEALKSPYVRMEYRYFFHSKKPILPLICKPAPMPAELVGIHHVTYSDIDRLINWLKRRIKDK